MYVLLCRAPFISRHSYHGPDQPIHVYLSSREYDSMFIYTELRLITGEAPSRFVLKFEN